MRLKKTYIQAYATGCPKQLQDVYILRKYEMPRNPAMEMGQNFHDFAFRFFDYVKWKELQEYRTFDDIVKYMALFVPKNIVPPLRDAMLNFCRFEAKHYLAVKDLGQEYFFPLDKEFVIDTETIDAHIDRIDLLRFENYVCPMEYKMYSAWHNGIFRSLRRELVFYCIALNVVPKYKDRAKYIASYNPLLDKFFFEPVHRNTVAAVIRWIYRLKDAVKKGDFPRRPGARCRTCPSAQECFLEDENVPLPII